MGEEFYSIIKLVSGEEIFSLVTVDETEGDPVIVLQNPLIMQMFKKLIEIYNNFISEEDKIEIHTPNGLVQPSPKMGYVSSVRDARKKLESLFNKNINNKET